MHDEVRFLIFDCMSQDQQTQRPGTGSLPSKSYGHLTGYAVGAKFSNDLYPNVNISQCSTWVIGSRNWTASTKTKFRSSKFSEYCTDYSSLFVKCTVARPKPGGHRIAITKIANELAIFDCKITHCVFFVSTRVY